MEEFEKMAASELEEAEMEAGEETAAPAAEEFNADLSVEAEEASDEVGDAADPRRRIRAAVETESASGVE